MKRTALEIYGLAVCFFAAAYFLFVFAETGWHVVQLSAPEFTMGARDWERHQSDEAFKESLESLHRDCENAHKPYVIPEGAALTKAREGSFAREVREQRRYAIHELVRNLIGIAIAAVLFLAHWRIAARAR